MDVDNTLLTEVQKLGGFKTKKAAVDAALAEYVRLRKQEQLIGAFGTVDWDPDYDYKAERSRASAQGG